MNTISFPVSKDFLNTLRDSIVTQKPCSGHYLCRLPLSTLPVLTECQSIIGTYFPQALLVDCVIYLGGESLDTPWHVDSEPGIWGGNYMNLLIPLIINGEAAIKVLQENIQCSKVIEVNSEDEGNVNLTLVTSDIQLQTKKYPTQEIKVEIGNAYIFSGASPHRTIPGGFRISIIVGFVQDKKELIKRQYSSYLDNELTKMFAILFNGVKSEAVSVLADRYDNYIQGLIKAKDTKRIHEGWRSAWMVALTVLSNMSF